MSCCQVARPCSEGLVRACVKNWLCWRHPRWRCMWLLRQSDCTQYGLECSLSVNQIETHNTCMQRRRGLFVNWMRNAFCALSRARMECVQRFLIWRPRPPRILCWTSSERELCLRSIDVHYVSYDFLIFPHSLELIALKPFVDKTCIELFDTIIPPVTKKRWFRNARTTRTTNHSFKIWARRRRSSSAKNRKTWSPTNTEIFDLCENWSKQQCHDCNLFWEIGKIYCSCGRNMKSSRNPTEFDQNNRDVTSIPGFLIN